MIDLLKNFSNFMMGALALAIVLLGSIVYPMLKKSNQAPAPRRRTPVKKKPAVRKAPVKKPVAKKPVKK